MTNYQVTFPDWPGTGEVTLHILTLVQWKHAIGLEDKGVYVGKRGRSVTAHARKHLRAPRSVSREKLVEFLQFMLDEVHKEIRYGYRAEYEEGEQELG